MEWGSGTLAWNGIAEPEPSNMEAEEQPKEVYSVKWKVASEMYWQLHRKSALLEYLTEHGPREFPQFKKRLKKLKKTLARFAEDEPFPNTIDSATNEKSSNIQALITEVASHVSVATVRLKQPGVRKFFAEGIGKHVLSALERKHSCLIVSLCEKAQVVPSDETEISLTSSLAHFDEIVNSMKKQVTSPEIVDEEFPLVDYEEMSWKSAVTELPQIEAVDSSECTWINSTQVRVCVGDLTKEEVDAVLIMNQDRLDLKKGGQLNKHIALTAGPSVQKECKRIIKENGAQLPGNAVLTDAGNLGCKNLLHIIAYPGKPQILDLQLGVKTGLQLADERGLGSVALPAIGAGQMGLSLADSARVLSGGILSFLERPPQNLRKIRIVLYDESLLSTFAQDVKNEFAPIKTLEEYSALSTARLDDDCLPEEPPWDDALSERSSKAPSATTAEFRVYGKDKKSVTNTVNSLRGVFARHCTLQRVTHKLVPRLLQNCWAWLCDVASKQETDLKKETHNSTIIVGGNSDDVAMVVGCIWQKINRLAENQSEVEKRRLLAQYVRWHYVILDREIAFSEKLSSTIEEACNQRCQEVTLLMNNLNYKVDFNSMTVMSCCSKYPPLRLSRKLLNETGVSTPDSWSLQPCFPDGRPSPVAMFPVLTTAEVEYQSVANRFYNTGGCGTLVSIERVQNLCLYQQYTTYRQEVERTNSISVPINRNELQLFHGTKASNVNSINRHGFNRTFCGMANGAVYGNGVYFASNASYSMGYATPDANGLRRMYLARVVVGFFAKGCKGLLVPPPLFPEQPEVLFDSVVDNTETPNVFVVFRDSQCYPEYLITFKTN